MEINNNNGKMSNGWLKEWSKLVLQNIEKINERLEQSPTSKDFTELMSKIQKNTEMLQQLDKKVAILETEFKVRAGLWGALSAALLTVGVILMKYLK